MKRVRPREAIGCVFIASHPPHTRSASNFSMIHSPACPPRNGSHVYKAPRRPNETRSRRLRMTAAPRQSTVARRASLGHVSQRGMGGTLRGWYSGAVECTVELLHSNSHSTTHSTWSTPWSSAVELRQRVNLAPTPCKRAARLHGVAIRTTNNHRPRPPPPAEAAVVTLTLLVLVYWYSVD